MNPQQITQLIQQQFAKLSQSARFNVGFISRHIHNDIDAPYAFQPILNYVGNINANASIQLLPQSWTSTYGGTGTYTITHNLNSLLYTVNVTSTKTGFVLIPNVSLSANSFTVYWYSTAPGLADCSFVFTLTNINNTAVKLPQYQGTLVSKQSSANAM